MGKNYNALRPAVFFDRDGTLNAAHMNANGLPCPPPTLDHFVLLPGAAEACKSLHQEGFLIVVATNQPDIGRGVQSLAEVEAMHDQLLKLIPQISRIEISCDPSDSDSARRRKPAPGMLLDAADALGIELSLSWMIGDRWRDIECGHRAGTRTILVGNGYGEHFPTPPNHVVASAAEAAKLIISSPSTQTINL